MIVKISKLLIILVFLFSDAVFAEDLVDEIDSGLREPLFIDLVRPIDSKKGQLEVNTLCHKNNSSKTSCAPEVEYVVADGFGVEPELPLDYNGKAESVKTTFQKRIDYNIISSRYSHAIQVIGEKNLQGHKDLFTVFYISGYNKKDISLVMLNGIKKKKNIQYC